MGNATSEDYCPGPIVLFGSGETSPSGRKIFESVIRELPAQPRVALVETPAGFELNSTQVIGRVGEFIQHRLQNYEPQIEIIHARKRGTEYSPDDPRIAAGLLDAHLVFMGPGSPSYAVRQLQDSVTWQYLIARHRLGATLAFASAATVAISSHALPVYEIYKVGEDVHWKHGLDFFGLYGLSLVFVPHWNNNDGGVELDTSRCFMGKSRFDELVQMLPPEQTIIGIDEKTGLYMNPGTGICKVIGLGGVTLIHTGKIHRNAINGETMQTRKLESEIESRSGHAHRFENGESFQMDRIGAFIQPAAGEGMANEIWQLVFDKTYELETRVAQDEQAPKEVMILMEKRCQARENKQWYEADRLREEIEKAGWTVMDTTDGPKVVKIGGNEWQQS